MALVQRLRTALPHPRLLSQASRVAFASDAGAGSDAGAVPASQAQQQEQQPRAGQLSTGSRCLSTCVLCRSRFLSPVTTQRTHSLPLADMAARSAVKCKAAVTQRASHPTLWMAAAGRSRCPCVGRPGLPTASVRRALRTSTAFQGEGSHRPPVPCSKSPRCRTVAARLCRQEAQHHEISLLSAPVAL